MELKATESMNTYFYMKSAIFYFQANNALQEKSIYIKLRDTTRPRIVFYYTFKKKKKNHANIFICSFCLLLASLASSFTCSLSSPYPPHFNFLIILSPNPFISLSYPHSSHLSHTSKPHFFIPSTPFLY